MEQQLQGIDMSKTTEEQCKTKDCGSTLFGSGSRIRRMSALVSPNGQELLIPDLVFYCLKCGKEFSNNLIVNKGETKDD